MDLSDDQSRALEQITEWYRLARRQGHNKRYLTMGGYAGTGKTTVVSQLQHALGSDVTIRYCAFTAKAASVMRESLRSAGVTVEGSARRRNGDTYRVKYVTTAHGLIKYHREIVRCLVSGRTLYDSRDPNAVEKRRCNGSKCSTDVDCRSYTDKSKEWDPRPREDLAGIDLIVLDEASMIGEDLWQDLLSYGRPILAVGDHGQLPPVAPPRQVPFNLMDEHRLDIRLERIHRQAEGSPILEAATYARTNGFVPYGVLSAPGEPLVAKLTHDQMDEVVVRWGDYSDIMALCGRNKTRAGWNKSIRAADKREGPVAVGDRVTCLRNSTNVFNGMLGTVTRVGEVSAGGVDLGIRVDNGLSEDDDELSVRVVAAQFGREDKIDYDELRQRRLTGHGLWDYGYVTTVHKSQGSSIDRVIVLEERLPGGIEKHKKWLYTAVTRARKSLIIVG